MGKAYDRHMERVGGRRFELWKAEKLERKRKKRVRRKAIKGIARTLMEEFRQENGRWPIRWSEIPFEEVDSEIQSEVIAALDKLVKLKLVKLGVLDKIEEV